MFLCFCNFSICGSHSIVWFRSRSGSRSSRDVIVLMVSWSHVSLPLVVHGTAQRVAQKLSSTHPPLTDRQVCPAQGRPFLVVVVLSPTGSGSLVFLEFPFCVGVFFLATALDTLLSSFFCVFGSLFFLVDLCEVRFIWFDFEAVHN